MVKAAELTVSEGWARASIPGAANGAAYVSLMNDSADNITLTGLSSEVSAKTELHTHVHEDGMMKMQHVPELTLRPGESVSMKPGSYHIMLMGLTSPLRAGAELALVLKFSDGTSQRMTLAVRKP